MAKKQSPVSKKFPVEFFINHGREGGLIGGRNGGLLGGPARAKALTKKRRKEIASMGGKAAALKRQERRAEEMYERVKKLPAKRRSEITRMSGIAAAKRRQEEK